MKIKAHSVLQRNVHIETVRIYSKIDYFKVVMKKIPSNGPGVNDTIMQAIVTNLLLFDYILRENIE